MKKHLLILAALVAVCNCYAPRRQGHQNVAQTSNIAVITTGQGYHEEDFGVGDPIRHGQVNNGRQLPSTIPHYVEPDNYEHTLKRTQNLSPFRSSQPGAQHGGQNSGFGNEDHRTQSTQFNLHQNTRNDYEQDYVPRSGNINTPQYHQGNVNTRRNPVSFQTGGSRIPHMPEFQHDHDDSSEEVYGQDDVSRNYGQRGGGSYDIYNVHNQNMRQRLQPQPHQHRPHSY